MSRGCWGCRRDITAWASVGTLWTVPSGGLLRGELGREAASEQLWDLLTLTMERQEWKWAKLIARHLSVICEGVLPAVESRLAGLMGVLQEKGDPDAMLLLAMVRFAADAGERRRLLLRAREIAVGQGDADVVEWIDGRLDRSITE